MYTLVVVLRFISLFFFFFFNDTATTEIYTLSLHDALPIYLYSSCVTLLNELEAWAMYFTNALADHRIAFGPCAPVYCSLIVRSEEHTSELQSRLHLVCRLLLEKKKKCTSAMIRPLLLSLLH